MKKKGFTFIELLAVIIILGVIALITIPFVTKIITNARRDTVVRSAVNYVAAVKKSVLKSVGIARLNLNYCDVRDDGTGTLDCDDGTVLEVDVEGSKPVGGTVYFEKGDIKYAKGLVFRKYTVSSNENGEFAIDFDSVNT